MQDACDIHLCVKAVFSKEHLEDLPFDEAVDLEMDELNQHECMVSMTALFRHMQRNNITPKVEEVREKKRLFSLFDIIFIVNYILY